MVTGTTDALIRETIEGREHHRPRAEWLGEKKKTATTGFSVPSIPPRATDEAAGAVADGRKYCCICCSGRFDGAMHAVSSGLTGRGSSVWRVSPQIPASAAMLVLSFWRTSGPEAISERTPRIYVPRCRLREASCIRVALVSSCRLAGRCGGTEGRSGARGSPPRSNERGVRRLYRRG